MPNHYPEYLPLKKRFGTFFGGWSKSETLSEIKIPLQRFNKNRLTPWAQKSISKLTGDKPMIVVGAILSP